MAYVKPNPPQEDRWEMTWEEVEQACDALVEEILTKDIVQVKTILAVAKGGVVPAALVWQRFPRAAFNTIRVSSYLAHGKQKPRVEWPNRMSIYDWNDPSTLIIDDICDSGDTFAALREYLPYARYACMLKREGNSFDCHYHQWVAPQGTWVMFPWEKVHDKHKA